jgi:hypothetical protein
MALAQHQGAWRRNSHRTRVEVYLDPAELAILDAMPGTRAEAVRALLAAASRLHQAPEIPDNVLSDLRAAFPGETGGINWPKLLGAVRRVLSLREAQAKRQKARRDSGQYVDTTVSERCRRYRERQRAKQTGDAPRTMNYRMMIGERVHR